MFEGFTPRTGEFLWELAFNNERPWFLEHKEEFERVVNAPFKALAADTMAAFERRFPDTDCRLHISRIYRDARRLFGRGPYKDHLWFSVKRSDALLEGPMFWFEIGPADYSFGMGFYSATPSQMAQFRRLIDANPAAFERLARRTEAIPGIRLTGEQYKRPKAEGKGEVIDRWYNRRRLGLELCFEHDGLLYSPALPEKLAETYEKLMPMYEFFLSFYRTGAEEGAER